MSIDLGTARQFIHNTARVLERHRLAALLDGGPTEAVLTALRAYRNPDGGFGHALEPDVRCPGSQPAATLTALEILAEVGAEDDPMVANAADWIASLSGPDGGVPTVLPWPLGHPRAPWMEPSEGGGFLTYALAARLWQLGAQHPWLDAVTTWCWEHLEAEEEPGGYTVKFALDFLDAVPDPRRATTAVERLRPAIRPDGTVGVSGGVQDEKIAVLDLSPRPGAPSRMLFTDAQVDADLDRLERAPTGPPRIRLEATAHRRGQPSLRGGSPATATASTSSPPTSPAPDGPGCRTIHGCKQDAPLRRRSELGVSGSAVVRSFMRSGWWVCRSAPCASYPPPVMGAVGEGPRTVAACRDRLGSPIAGLSRPSKRVMNLGPARCPCRCLVAGWQPVQ